MSGTLDERGSKREKPMKALHTVRSLPASSTTGSIEFYNRSEPYYEFTNFYRATVHIDGKDWPTTEHYFQAQKFIGTPYMEKIRFRRTAREAFQLSRDPKVSCWKRSDWEDVKDDIMLKALRHKFAQHQSLREKLWQTGSKELIEHTVNDSYWGDGGGRGMGQNRLGKLLMQIREEIVAVCGHYRPRRELRPRMKRSLSLSDLSRCATGISESSIRVNDSLMPKIDLETAGKSSYPSPQVSKSHRNLKRAGSIGDVSDLHSRTRKTISVRKSSRKTPISKV